MSHSLTHGNGISVSSSPLDVLMIYRIKGYGDIIPGKNLADFLEDCPVRKVLEVGWLWLLLLIISCYCYSFLTVISFPMLTNMNTIMNVRFI